MQKQFAPKVWRWNRPNGAHHAEAIGMAETATGHEAMSTTDKNDRNCGHSRHSAPSRRISALHPTPTDRTGKVDP